MGIKLVLDSIDKLSDEEKKLYTERDGKFYLDFEGDLPESEAQKKEKDKIKEFRENNIKLTKELEQIKGDLEKFKDVDPAKYAEAVKKLQLIDDKKLMDEGKIDELVQGKTERMRKDFETKLTAALTTSEDSKKELKKVRDLLAGVTIDNAIQLYISKHTKPRKDTMLHIISHGRSFFSVDEDGKPVARDDKGELMFSKDGTTPLTIEEWAQNLPAEKPFFFEDSKGSGAGGGGDGDLKGVTAKELADMSPTQRLKVIHSKGIKK